MSREQAPGGTDEWQAMEDDLRAQNEHLLEALRVAEETRDRYADLYDHAPLALLTLDIIGVVHELNLGAAALLGTDERRSMVGKRFKSFVVESDQNRLVEHLRNSSTSDTSTVSLQLVHRDNEPVPVQLWSRRAKHNPRLYPTAIVDMRERQQATQEISRLRDAEQKARAASEAKDQFIAMLSHELRTPLTPVLAAVSALVGRMDTPPVLRNLCEMIHRNIVTEARLIDDLLDVTRIARGKVRLEQVVMNVHEAARQALEMLSDEVADKYLTVVVALEAERHWAFADPVRIRQVFWNLLRNATKFTNPGGRIELHSWNSEGRLAVEVSDSGVGFDPAEVPRLFQAFEQDPDASRVHGGLGLGLAICKGLIELHGGRIVGTSRGANQGARFVIEVDAAPEPDLALSACGDPSATAGSSPSMPARPCILLVEDDPDTADMLRDILSDAGYEVRSANSTRSALALELEGVDILLSDIGLPDGSGLELMRQLRDKGDIKGIALSGYGTEADKRASLEAGFSAHLTKPIEIDGLLQAIGQVGAGPRVGAAH